MCVLSDISSFYFPPHTNIVFPLAAMVIVDSAGAGGRWTARRSLFGTYVHTDDWGLLVIVARRSLFGEKNTIDALTTTSPRSVRLVVRVSSSSWL